MKFEVVVELKEEVLDTQGRAIQQTLQRLGHEPLSAVKVSKRFVLDIAGEDEALASALVKTVASAHLANPVAETFTFRRL